MLVLSHVIRTVLIYRACVAGSQVTCNQTQRLFVVLNQLRLVGVCDTADAGRQHVVYGSLVGVLFYADVAHLQGTAAGRSLTSIEWLLVGTPVALNHVERSKTQDNIFLEVGQEQTHEADAGKVVDVTLLALVVRQRYAEQVPLTFLRIAVAQLHAGCTHISDVVTSHHHILWSDTDVVLIVFLVFVQCIVLVDVLQVGGTLP